MLVSIDSNSRTNFRAIKLSEAEVKKSKSIIKDLAKLKTSASLKHRLQRNLFDIFSPHIYKETVLKSKSYYIFDDVLSEMYLKFSELLNNIKKNTSLETFVNTLNEYFPSRETRKGKYFYTTTDAKRVFDLLIYRKMLEMNNEHTPHTNKVKNLSNRLEDAEVSDTAKKRFKQKMEGVNYSEIGRRENISHASARTSVMNVVIKMQNKEGTLPEKYKEKAKDIAEVLGCKDTDVIKTAEQWSVILDQKPETIANRIKQSAELLQCSPDDYKKAVVKRMHLAVLSPEKVHNNIQELSQLLACPQEKLVKSALKIPQLFCQKPETLNANIEQLAQLLKCQKNDLVKAVFRQPSLLCRAPEPILKNVNTTSELLGCSPEEFTKAALKQPSLFMRTPVSIKENVEKSSKLLRCTEQEFISAGLKLGALFAIKPETLLDNAQKSSKLLNMSEENFIKMSISKPTYFCMKPESLFEKRKILNYYKRLQNLPPANIINVQSNKSLYSEIIRFLIQKTDPKNPSYFVKVFNFETFLKKNADKNFSFEIPDDEIVPAFIKFVQDTSLKEIDKNIFEFKISA